MKHILVGMFTVGKNVHCVFLSVTLTICEITLSCNNKRMTSRNCIGSILTLGTTCGHWIECNNETINTRAFQKFDTSALFCRNLTSSFHNTAVVYLYV